MMIHHIYDLTLHLSASFHPHLRASTQDGLVAALNPRGGGYTMKFTPICSTKLPVAMGF